MNRQKQAKEMTDKELKLYLVGIGMVSLFVFMTLLVAKLLTPIQLLYTHISISCFGFIYFLTVYFTKNSPFKHESIIEQQQKLHLMHDEIIVRINGKELLRL